MADVDRLLSEYIQEHKREGSADPLRYLDQVEGGDRHELTALIDGYLARAPRRAWDPDAYARSGASALVDRLDRALHGESGRWPTLLPELREKRRLARSELVKRLAAALGVTGREDKVAAYYHEMEQGLLPARGVSERVLDALAEIVGAPAEALRRAGEAASQGGAPPAPGAVFTRMSAPAEVMEEALPVAGSPARAEPWDEVDQLFRGGS